MNPIEAYIALGSNLGDRRAIIESAIRMLRATSNIEVTAVSSMIETQPEGFLDQAPFLNAAAELRTTLAPEQLLAECLRIEAAHGRDRKNGQRWGPRLLDIDLLLYGEAIIDQAGLRIPHPHMHLRQFVLEPLAQIAPHAVHPALGASIQSLLQSLPARVDSVKRKTMPCPTFTAENAQSAEKIIRKSPAHRAPRSPR